MIIASIPEILPQVTSPLALAALLLLLGAGVLRVIAKGRDRTGLRSALKWVFVSAIVLGGFANISFIATARMSGETRVAGQVRNDAGDPLGSVVVELRGTGSRGITDDYGNFDFNLPYSRRAERYELSAYLPGYSLELRPLPGPRLPSLIDLTLKRPDLNPEKIVLLPGASSIMHQLGLPLIDLDLTLANPLPWPVEYKRLKVTLRAPDGKETPMEGMGHVTPFKQYMPFFMPDGELKVRGESRLIQRYYSWSEKPDELLVKADAEARATWNPANGSVRLSPTLVRQLEDFCDRVWFWTPGQWLLTVDLVFDGRPVQRSFRFEITDMQIKRMKETKLRYPEAIGVIQDRPFPPEAIQKIDLRASQ